MRLRALAMLALMVILPCMLMGVVAAQAPSISGDVFYFHLISLAYSNTNSSAILVNEANPNLPIGSAPSALTVAAAIRNATTIFGTIWVGSVAWVTQPLAEPTTLQGPATFTVWLSSNENVTPTFSGVGAGIAVLNQQNQTVGNYVYKFTYAQGKVLTSTSTPYSFDVQINQAISPGQRLVLAVGVGSTTEGWRMNVLFDDAEHQSRVQLPLNIAVVSEFPDNLPILTILTIGLSIILIRPKFRGKRA